MPRTNIVYDETREAIETGPKFLLIIPGRLTEHVESFEQASARFATLRDESGEGASTFPDGIISDFAMNVARISYNAKVWPMADWESGMTPLFDPYATA